MKSEERKSRLVVEETVRDGKERIALNFEGTMEKYSVFVASVISSYRSSMVKAFGLDIIEVVNESLKDFIDLEGTHDEVKKFPEKVFSRLKDSGDIDVKAVLERLLRNLLQ